MVMPQQLILPQLMMKMIIVIMIIHTLLTITDRGNIEHLLCSRKWANPGMSSGSEKLPAPMQRAAADWEDEEIKYCYLR